jgi:hypothetical protein
MKLPSIRSVAVIIASVFVLAGGAQAQGYKVEALNEPPPQDLAAAIRAELSSTGLRISGPAGPICDLWLRKTIPLRAATSTELGVSFPQLAEGTLIGAMHLPNVTKDYRRQQVKPGVYTLRYGINPQNGDHMGVAPQRDFLMASTAAVDQDPATLTLDQTFKLSKSATGSAHASVWSLSSAESNPKSLPSVFHMDDGDLWLVEFQVTTSGAPLNMALVVAGFAPEA